MSNDDNGIHLYGTPEKPKPPPTEGLRGERTTSNDEAIDPQTHGTPGGQPPEKVEDRPNVGTVKPEDYPADERANGVT